MKFFAYVFLAAYIGMRIAQRGPDRDWKDWTGDIVLGLAAAAAITMVALWL